MPADALPHSNDKASAYTALINKIVMHFFFHLAITLPWRHNDHDSVSNHQPHGCLLNRLFRRRSNETSKLRVTGLCVGNSPGPVNSRTKGQLRGKCLHLMTSSWIISNTLSLISRHFYRIAKEISRNIVAWMFRLGDVIASNEALRPCMAKWWVMCRVYVQIALWHIKPCGLFY